LQLSAPHIPLLRRPQVVALGVPAQQVTADTLQQVLTGLNRGSCSGLSGWPHGTCRPLRPCGEAAFGVVRRLVNLILRGGFPRDPTLLDSALIGLQKPDVRGVRPIAIRFRLNALFALAACADVGAVLVPVQLAVAVFGGSQVLTHALRAGIAEDPKCATLKVDIGDAFSSVRLDLVSAVVAARVPLLCSRFVTRPPRCTSSTRPLACRSCLRSVACGRAARSAASLRAGAGAGAGAARDDGERAAADARHRRARHRD
jgi:hypothetical protein